MGSTGTVHFVAAAALCAIVNPFRYDAVLLPDSTCGCEPFYKSGPCHQRVATLSEVAHRRIFLQAPKIRACFLTVVRPTRETNV